MDTMVWLLISALLVLVITLFLLAILLRGDKEKSEKHAGALKTQLEVLESQLRVLRETLSSRLHQSAEITNKQIQTQAETMNNQMNVQFESSKKVVENITKELTKIEATGREMLSFTKQLQALERTLKNPQRRGVVGEQILEQVIENVLPPEAYAIQYSFKNGVRADAVVFLQNKKMISIDAKFSLENYTKLLEEEGEKGVDNIKQRLKEDLKARIQETAKYILPKEGTLDYAFMFIPSESLYYDLLTQKIGTGGGMQNMLEYAFAQHRVIIVSPTTLLAYLQTVTLGLRSLQVEERAEEIIKRVGSLRKRLENHADAFHGVGKALSTVVNHYNKAEQQYDLIDKDIFKITGDGGEYKRDLLNKPHSTEHE